MRNTLLIMAICLVFILPGQTVKSKALKLKYTPPAGWGAEEFGDKESWDKSGNNLCRCSGVIFTKQNPAGQMKALVYPSSQQGLDSVKRSLIGNLKFVMVEKYEKSKNKNFSFEVRRSNFTDIKANKPSFAAIRYLAKVEDHFYIIYAWQEKEGLLNSTSEKELFEMVNAIEPN
jgi:hypothetical protein